MNVLVVLSEGERVVLRLDDVVEVLPMLALAGVAEAAGRFRGLLNLRGEVVPVHELGGGRPPLHQDRYIVLCRGAAGARLAGVLVDDVLEVLDLPVHEQEVGGGRRVSVAQRGQDLLPVIDPSAAPLVNP